jgi:hypothetical protein
VLSGHMKLPATALARVFPGAPNATSSILRA